MSHVIEMTCNAEYVHGRAQKTQVLAEDDGSLFHVLTTFQAFMRAMGFSNETIERHVKADLDKTTLQGNDLSGKIETELHWDEHHERRIDLIGQNGGDGLHYQPKFGPPLWSDFSAERGDDEESQV